MTSVERTIPILMNVTRSHFLLLAVCLYSISKSSKKPELLEFFIVTDGFTEEQVSIINSLGPFKTNFIDMRSLNLPDHRSIFYNSEIVYARLLFDEINIQTQKLIYLDCDTIVNCDITNLLDYSNNDNPVSACLDISLSRASSIFNAGVMVVDRNAWQKHEISKRVNLILAADAHDMPFADQHVLNACLDGNFARIPPRWNQQVSLRIPGHKHYGEQLFSASELEEAVSNPAIIHFNSTWVDGRWAKTNTKPHVDKAAGSWLALRNELFSLIR